jgi:uracil-DNA glycosylase
MLPLRTRRLRQAQPERSTWVYSHLPQTRAMEKLLNDIANCTLCQERLGGGCKPVVVVHPQAKLMITGQAPSRRVHESGTPWNDPSGDRIRSRLKMDKEEFYDREKVAIMPMGFCFSGARKSGDLPPHPECAPLWHPQLRRNYPILNSRC